MATETRVCVRCFGSGRYARCEKADERPVATPCSACSGSGWVAVWLYPKRKEARA